MESVVGAAHRFSHVSGSYDLALADDDVDGCRSLLANCGVVVAAGAATVAVAGVVVVVVGEELEFVVVADEANTAGEKQRPN